MWVACDTCRRRRSCRMLSAQHQATVMAWAHRVPAPDCLEYQERTWRGIEGVLDCPPLSPRPSQTQSPKMDLS